MRYTPDTLKALTDDDLVSEFGDFLIVDDERLLTRLDFVAELDRRHLFYGCSSLWEFLITEKGMESWDAERLINTSRKLARFPELRKYFELGRMNPTLLELVQACVNREKLDDAEHWELIKAVAGKTSRAAQKEILARYPRSQPLPRDRVIPMTEDRSQVRCMMTNADLEIVEDVRGLLAHSHPGIPLGELFGLLAREYRKRHHPEEKARRAEARKAKAPSAPRVQPEDRRTPTQATTHEMISRDGYSCAYVCPKTGRRCNSTYGLEQDHIQAWADGGPTELRNLRGLCANHHRRVTFLCFGEFKPRPLA